MKDLQEFITSGILEQYVLGDTSDEEDAEVLMMAGKFPEEIAGEILGISTALEYYALENAIEPDPVIGPFLLAKIDYMDRLMAGELFSVVPPLSEFSLIEDYAEWINREDMVAPEDFEGIFAKILSHTDALTAALVWLREMAPQEVHDDQYERFLILEGSCDIAIEDHGTHSLKRGDYLQIPLHKNHHVTVTSIFPCKILLQRVAA
ncbi:cupin domain-containing protein [Pedobacter hartonius]|uniref:Cupin domain-containing protein n=1 Tax=Pedobacter hartonius TaxID=425514 RepID=A0A1H4EM67_9SPHI|nr:cupin domain-containing protein [Pedobacter hartonius]SEA85322.1 Cupin domain-containing protein [Pedobacter hartonius]